jgi:hypothetical protein
MWAIREGLHRIDPMRVEWHEVKANKDHVGTRGCAIKRNAVYFQLQSGAGWGSELKVCAACLAIILYFQRVHELPPYVKTHWARLKLLRFRSHFQKDRFSEAKVGVAEGLIEYPCGSAGLSLPRINEEAVATI